MDGNLEMGLNLGGMRIKASNDCFPAKKPSSYGKLSNTLCHEQATV